MKNGHGQAKLYGGKKQHRAQNIHFGETTSTRSSDERNTFYTVHSSEYVNKHDTSRKKKIHTKHDIDKIKARSEYCMVCILYKLKRQDIKKKSQLEVNRTDKNRELLVGG